MSFDERWQKGSPFHFYQGEDKANDLEIRRTDGCFLLKYAGWKVELWQDGRIIVDGHSDWVPEEYLGDRLANPLQKLLWNSQMLGIHASAVCDKKAGIAFLGEPFAGKSTFCAKYLHAVREDVRFYSDDILVVRIGEKGAEMQDGATRLYLRDHLPMEPVATYVGGNFKEQYIIADTYRASATAHLRYIASLHPSDHFQVERISASDSLPRLMKQAFDVSSGDDTWKAARFHNIMSLLRMPDITWLSVHYNRRLPVEDESNAQQLKKWIAAYEEN